MKKLQQADVCLPFLQLAMMHFQRGDWLYIPVEYTESVRDSMIPHVPINSILHVCDCLRDRDFKQFPMDSQFRTALRTRCLCCGKILKIGGPSEELNLDFHLRAAHPEPQQAIQVLIEMLQYFHANDSGKTCERCLTDLTTHDDGDVASYLSACGPIRNLVTWLCGPLLLSTHGGSAGSDGGRLH